MQASWQLYFYKPTAMNLASLGFASSLIKTKQYTSSYHVRNRALLDKLEWQETLQRICTKMHCGYTRTRVIIFTQRPIVFHPSKSWKANATAIMPGMIWWHTRNIKQMSLTYFHGLNIFIVLDTCVRQNGHRDTELEHLLHKTWPHGIRVMLTSEFRQTRHDHADLAISASLTADSAFSYSGSSNRFSVSYASICRRSAFSWNSEEWLYNAN
jgi:hypothetical protein